MEFDRKESTLSIQEAFPDIDKELVELIYQENNYDIDQTLTQLFMINPEEQQNDEMLRNVLRQKKVFNSDTEQQQYLDQQINQIKDQNIKNRLEQSRVNYQQDKQNFNYPGANSIYGGNNSNHASANMNRSLIVIAKQDKQKINGRQKQKKQCCMIF